jgi:hypothetical protein
LGVADGLVKVEPARAVEGRSIRNVSVVAVPVEATVGESIDPPVILGDTVDLPVVLDPVIVDLWLGDIVSIIDLLLELIELDALVIIDIEELPVVVELMVEVADLFGKVQGSGNCFIPSQHHIAVASGRVEVLEE